MKNDPLNVSVVAANYNNAEFLHDFFTSWMDSITSPKELIFVDDGSVDNSLEIAEFYRDKLPNLIIIKLGKNQGFGNALNVGISRATSKYILRIDPDDITLPSRIAKQYELLESGVADVIGSNAIIFQSKSGKKIGLTNFPVSHEEIRATILRGEHGVLHPTVMARADLFKNNSYVQKNVPAEDYDIFARMLHAGAKFENIPEPLLRYRVHQRSASNVLPFSTIEKTYKIRDKIFGTKTPRILVFHYYLHIKFYRKYIFSESNWKRFLFLFVSSLLRPDKVARRIFKGIGVSN
nr:glycosyltransferase [uncultured Albidiferax sp.]